MTDRLDVEITTFHQLASVVRFVVRGVLFLAVLIAIGVIAGVVPPTPVFLAIAISVCLVFGIFAAAASHRHLEPLDVPVPHAAFPDPPREERGL